MRMRTLSAKPAPLVLGAALVLAALVTAPAAAFAQSNETVLTVKLDSRRAADLAKRSNGELSVSDLLRQAGSAELRGPRGMQVVLYAYHLRRGEIVRHYHSSPFTIAPNSTYRLRESVQPGQPEYGNIPLNPEHVIEAGRLVPARAAVDEPGRFVINGIFAGKPDGWERMDAIYIVAAPVDQRFDRTTVVGPAVAFAMPMPDY